MGPDIKALIQILMEGQIRTDKSVNELAGAIGSHMDIAGARAARMDEARIQTDRAISSLTVTVDRYVASADARMKRI